MTGASTGSIETSGVADQRRTPERLLEPLSLLARIRESFAALAGLVRDLAGMLDFLDLLNLVGKSLLRIPIKGLTLLFLVFLGVNTLSRAVGIDAIDDTSVKSFSVGYALIAIFGGILLVLTAVMVRGSRLTQAQAFHLNLTEVRKRTESGQLVRSLWRNVYAEEAQVLLDPEERRSRDRSARDVLKRLHEEPFRGTVRVPGAPLGGETIDRRELAAFRTIREEGLYFTRRGFLFLASRLLQHPIPPHLYRWFSGLDFSRVADYFDGGYFDVSDDRLAFQFAASPVLARARRLARLPPLVKLRYGVGAGIRRLWFLLVSRSFALQVSRLVSRLEQEAALKFGHEPLDADGRFFNALHLLWSTPESDGEVERVLGRRGLVSLAAARRLLIRAVFGRKPLVARRAIDRMFGPNWLYTHEVRKRSDPDYLRRLDRRHLRDLAFLGLPRGRQWVERRDVAQRAAALDGFEAVLRRHAPPELCADREALRALEFAFLVDEHGLRTAAARLAERTQPGAGENPAHRAFLECCRNAAGAKEVVTLTLRELRIHHLLCREQIVNYRRQVAELTGTAAEAAE